MPSPRGVRVSRVRSAASCSSLSNALRSASSLISGATTSRTLRARRRSSVGAKSSASAMRCSSACSRISAGEPPPVVRRGRARSRRLGRGSPVRRGPPHRGARGRVEGSGEVVEAGAGSVVVAGGGGVPVANRPGAGLVGDVTGRGHHGQQESLVRVMTWTADASPWLCRLSGTKVGLKLGVACRGCRNARDNVQQRVLLVVVVDSFHGLILRSKTIE